MKEEKGQKAHKGGV